MTTAASAGQPAKIDWRPKTASIKVTGDVMTVAENPKPITIEQQGSGEIRVSGEIAAGSPLALNIWHVPDPAAFARTAFIEALERAGVKVDANPFGRNPAEKLPGNAAYSAENKVAEHVSPPLSEFVKVILKVSYNRGAHLMLCLAAVKAESRDCAAGIGKELELLDRLGVSRQSTYVFDGAGSNDHGKTAPATRQRSSRESSRSHGERPSGTGWPSWAWMERRLQTVLGPRRPGISRSRTAHGLSRRPETIRS